MEKKWEIGMDINNKEEFKEFASGISRKEFERDYLSYDNITNDFGFRLNGRCIDCPDYIGLNHKECKKYKTCKQCWLESIEDVYFKDDIEKAKLTKECNNIKEKESITYDYDREYTLQELFEFPDKTIFTCSDNSCKVRIITLTLEISYIDKDDWYEGIISYNWLIDKYKLIPTEKEVTFQELLNSDCDCRVEFYNCDGNNYKSEYGSFAYVLGDLNYNHDSEYIKNVIKFGKWYMGGDK